MSSRTMKAVQLSSIIAASAVLVISAAGGAYASPAAPSVPSNQQLLAIDCDNFPGQLWGLQSDGAAQTVGTAGNINGMPCSKGIAVDPISQTVYYLAQTDPSGPNVGLITVNTVNPTSGNTTTGPLVQVPIQETPFLIFISNSGSAYVEASDGSTTNLYSLNLSNGATSLIGPISFRPAAGGYDTISGRTFLIDSSNSVFTLNLNNATTTPFSTPSWGQVTCLNSNQDPISPDGSISFDVNGVGWFASDSCNSALWAWNPNTNDAWGMGQIYDSNFVDYASPGDFYTQTLLLRTSNQDVVPQPSNLPETGLDLLEIFPAALALVLLGALLYISAIKIRTRKQ